MAAAVDPARIPALVKPRRVMVALAAAMRPPVMAPVTEAQNPTFLAVFDDILCIRFLTVGFGILQVVL